MFELDNPGIQLAIEILVVLAFCAYAVMYIIEFLKMRGVIKDGQAGKVNEALSFVIGLVGFLLLNLHAEGRIDLARDGALLLAPGVAFVIATVLGSKLWYEAVKWVRGQHNSTGIVVDVKAGGGSGPATPVTLDGWSSTAFTGQAPESPSVLRSKMVGSFDEARRAGDYLGLYPKTGTDG